MKRCAARAQTKDCLHRVDSGSGKSYTMMGEKNNRGIIPRFSEEMWNKIQAKPDVDCKVGSVPFVLAPFCAAPDAQSDPVGSPHPLQHCIPMNHR